MKTITEHRALLDQVQKLLSDLQPRIESLQPALEELDRLDKASEGQLVGGQRLPISAVLGLLHFPAWLRVALEDISKMGEQLPIHFAQARERAQSRANDLQNLLEEARRQLTRVRSETKRAELRERIQRLEENQAAYFATARELADAARELDTAAHGT